MQELTDFTITALAASRLSRLIVEDELTRPVREAVAKAGIYPFDYLVSCRACSSVWTAVGLTLAGRLVPRPVRVGLAASEVAVLISKFEKKEGGW